MSKQRHDIGWQKAHREGRATARVAAAHRRGQAKAAKAARRAALLEAAHLAGEKVEREAIRARERAAAGDVQTEPAPVPLPAPPPLVDSCANCGCPVNPSKKGRGKAYCSVACRKRHLAARNTPAPVGR